jgi:hypothetical protein
MCTPEIARLMISRWISEVPLGLTRFDGQVGYAA